MRINNSCGSGLVSIFVTGVIFITSTAVHSIDHPVVNGSVLLMRKGANRAPLNSASEKGDLTSRLVKFGYYVEQASYTAAEVKLTSEVGRKRIKYTSDKNNPCKKLRRALLRGNSAHSYVLGYGLNTCDPNYVVSIDAVPNEFDTPAERNSYGNFFGAAAVGGINAGNYGRVFLAGPTGLPAYGYSNNGVSDVAVMVIDTGIDYRHADLSANMWFNPLENNTSWGSDSDSNGYVDDIHGINAITGSGNPLDDHGHGTHCSGVIGARGNNNIGFAGINWNISLIGCKFLGSNGNGSTADALECVDYATALKQRGVNLIATNNSWGGGGFSNSMLQAIGRLKTAGTLFVAAAGNSGVNIDATPHYPASYTNGNIISVAALNHSNGTRASFSNYGAIATDIAAPGYSILSTVNLINGSLNNERYSYMSGTSMAAPHVTGAVALIKANYPGASITYIKDLIMASVTPNSNFTWTVRSGGTLNLYNAITTARAARITSTGH